MRRPSLQPRDLAAILAKLKRAEAQDPPAGHVGSGGREPVHTVYGGAHLFKADVAHKLGSLALKALHQHAPEPAVLAQVLGFPERLAKPVHRRVADKLGREPIEDFRIDFEDGYGLRPDEEEDHHAVLCADELCRGFQERTLPPFCGIRVKPLARELRQRSLRTLDLFVSAAAARTRRLPEGFVVTLPKVCRPEEVAALATALERLEARARLARRSLKLELMIETPRSVIAAGGEAAPRALVLAAGGRCVAAHFGTYDYTASLEITAAHQDMAHPACDFAKHVLQLSLAGGGVRISDGATNVMPVGPHKAAPAGALTSEQVHENVLAVHRAWKLHFDHVRRSLACGYYQGWDLHPAQLPSRYAAVYSFFLEGLPAASTRLKAFLEHAAQATLSGAVFDDAATGQGLLNYFLRAWNCGAVGDEEVRAAGLTLEELRSRSFLRILEGRRSSKRRGK